MLAAGDDAGVPATAPLVATNGVPPNTTARGIRDAIRTTLGDNSALKALIVFVVTFWPIIVFYDHIAFDPARFVEEWLKGAVLSLLVYLALHVAHRHNATIEASKRTDTIATSLLLDPFSRVMGVLRMRAAGPVSEEALRSTSADLEHIRISISETIPRMLDHLELEFYPWLRSEVVRLRLLESHDMLRRYLGPGGTELVDASEIRQVVDGMNRLGDGLVARSWRRR